MEKDLQVRSTIEEWEKFRKEADSMILAGRICISQASDCYDDPQTRHRGRVKSAIIKAESKLEKLSDKMLQARKYSTDTARFEAFTAEGMHS